MDNTKVKYHVISRPHCSATGFPIAAILGSFVALLHVKNFLASKNLLKPTISQIICVGARDAARAWD